MKYAGSFLPEDREERVDAKNDTDDDESVVLLFIESDTVQRGLPIIGAGGVGDRAVKVV